MNAGGRVIKRLLRHCIAVRLAVVLLAYISCVYPVNAATDQRINYPQAPVVTPFGVNLQTGRFTYSKVDISVGPLQFIRSWSDEGMYFAQSHVFGLRFQGRKASGWGHNFGQAVYPTNEGNSPYLYVYAEGVNYKFFINASGGIVPSNKASHGTSFSNGVFTDKSGNKFTYSGFSDSTPSFRPLSRVDYADGAVNTYFYSAGALKYVISNRGYAIVLDYNTSGNITAACGYNLTLQYVTATTTCASAQLKVSYSYDAVGAQLKSVTDVSGSITTISGSYVYGGNQIIGPTCISFPGSSTCWVQNIYGTQPDGSGTSCCYKPDQVGEQIAADGGKWLFNHTPQDDPADVPPVVGRPRWSSGEMIDPLGRSRAAWFDRGVLVDYYEPTGLTRNRYIERSGSTDFITYDLHDTSPALVTFPDGHSEYFAHDLRGNVTFRFVYPNSVAATAILATDGSPLLSSYDPDLAWCCVSSKAPNTTGTLISSMSYPADYFASGSTYPTGCGGGPADAKLCNKPTAIFDANLNKTDIAYSSVHGGILKVTQPADDAGKRPEARYGYTKRYAWTLNSSGTGYTRSTDGIWLLTSKSVCKTGTAASSGTGCTIAGDEVVTTYDYGPDSGPSNLLLRGIVEDATDLALRTCYGYDWQGNRISETKPRANLTSCP